MIKLRNKGTLAIALFAMAGGLCSCKKEDSGAKVKIDCTTQVMKNSVNVYFNVVTEGDWTVRIVYDEGTAGWAGFDKERTQQTTSGTGESVVLLQFSANDTGVDRTLNLVLEASGKADTSYFVQRKHDGSGKDIPDEEPKWLELPKIKNSGLEYYIHDMTVEGKLCRNYSFYYDPARLVSHCVCYPMWKNLLSTGGRSDAWGLYDPRISENRQQYLKKGYGGYDRGHQLPSRDRNKVGAANVETFYGPNITPQLAGLNQRAWVDLEGKVHNWTTSFDTLYIVTGCTVLDSDRTIGDNNGKKVTIPTAYYKALLGYKKRDGAYFSIAFYYPHEASNADPSSKALTVYQLEDKLLKQKDTIEFFVNLAESKKATVKSMNYDTWLNAIN